MTDSNAPSAEFVKSEAIAVGFDLCGITNADPTDYRDELIAWLEAGKHGSMSYLADHLEVRVDPRKLLDGARSIICVADRLPAPADSPDTTGRVARYAHVSDYHKVMKKKLIRLADRLRDRVPDADFKACVDTAPILEREYAMRAGLGWVGKHTLLMNQEVGSHMLLGELLTTLDLEHDRPATTHCGTCTRCIDACPTQCISPWSVDATRCISYLTIEHRDQIDESFHAPIDDWLYGCDVCQDVCPFNRKASEAGMPAGFEERDVRFDAIRVLDWTEDGRREAFIKSAMKRVKLGPFKRNALLVLGNLPKDRLDPALRDRIRELASDPNEPTLVRNTARVVLNRL